MRNLHEKLQYVQQQLQAPKAQFNAFGKYNYRSLEDITEAVKPLLKEVDAYITICDYIEQIGDRFYVKANVEFRDGGCDTIVVTAFAREALDRKGMDVSQITGAASSYARKYAMNGLLLIDDTRDADNTNEHGQDEEANAKKTSAKKTVQDKSNVIVEQAFFSFTTEHKDECLEHFVYSKEKFTAAIIKHFKALPTRKDSIKKILETIKPEEVMEEIQKGETE